MIIRQYTTRAWGLIHTKSQCEKKVRRILKNYSIPVYLPCVHVSRSKYRSSQYPMFKGYLFAAWSEEEKRTIICCPGVESIIASPINGDDAIIMQLQRLSQLEEISKKYEVNLSKFLPAQLHELPISIKKGMLKKLERILEREINSKKASAIALNGQGTISPATDARP